ncbi:hypothetical protein I4F81_000741 [Pyropia yezoensis]|uniref:Uncharacterized protein n=1 Tax=Pyropia yezoensis TaxID=2788 RepID=A0ACC3BK79_PYRYE|nr:hypothetical protein I4F81_000741 [Neopyropia yezoensis]
MGSGRSWTEAEDCALARAYAAVVVDNSNGADQTKADLCLQVHHAYKILVGEKDPPDNEVSRTARALEGRWPTVAQCVHAIKDAYRRVRNQILTGNLDEQDLISAATAVIRGMGAYAGVREDRDKDKKKAVTPVRVRVRCGMKELTRTCTPTDTRDTAGRRSVDKDPTPVTRRTMDSDSDVQLVQEAWIAPRNPTMHHAASAASGGLPLSGSYGTTAAALLEQATVNAPLPLPAEPGRLAPLQAPRLAPRPAVFPPALATPPSRNMSRGAKAQRTKEAVSKRAAQPQPSPTIHIDLTASDGGDATDAGEGVAPEATDGTADHKPTDRKTDAATL